MELFTCLESLRSKFKLLWLKNYLPPNYSSAVFSEELFVSPIFLRNVSQTIVRAMAQHPDYE